MAILHAGVAADVLLGLKLRLEETVSKVCVPWTGGESVSGYPSLPSDLRVFREAMERAATAICVLPPNPELWWTAWVAGCLTAVHKPVALFQLPDGGPLDPEAEAWWLREVPYLVFSKNQFSMDTVWIHSSDLAHVHIRSWIDGRKPYAR